MAGEQEKRNADQLTRAFYSRDFRKGHHDRVTELEDAKETNSLARNDHSLLNLIELTARFEVCNVLST